MTSDADRSVIASLPVDGPFEDADLEVLAAADLGRLSEAMRRAPVDGPFSPKQALALARCSDLEAALSAAEVKSSEAQGPIDAAAFVSLAQGISE